MAAFLASVRKGDSGAGDGVGDPPEPEEAVVTETPAPAESAKPRKQRAKKDPESLRKTFRVVGEKKPRREKEAGWPPNPAPGYSWRNPNDGGVSLFRRMGMKTSSKGNPMKDLEYVGHFTWTYLEKIYGKQAQNRRREKITARSG
jgi:hypothetical protein